jgi:flagellum-specific peptidoglycan hydrolase FlgJ
MERFGVLSTAALLLLLGSTASAYARQEQHEEETKPENRAEAKPAKQEESKPVKQEATKPEKQQEAQPAQAKSNQQQPAQRTPAEEQRQRAVPALRLSARGSARIPDDRFRANFGHEHLFVISQPVVVTGYSRFQYGGFWSGFVQPWPVGWYYTDDV